MKRPREHELETLSDAFLVKFFSNWVCNKFQPDYGLDYKVTIVENGNVSSNFFFVQNKATDTIRIMGDNINFDLDVKHILHFLQLPIPVLLILYDAQKDEAYWINIQKHCREVMDIEDPNWKIEKKFKRIKIPISNKLKDKYRIKNEIIQASKEQLRYITDNYNWFEGYEAILTHTDKLEEIINKKEIDSIEARLHISGIYFQKGDQEKLTEQFLVIYQKDGKDIYHLQAILGLITSSNPLDININEKLHKLSLEGLNLAKDLNKELYLKIFIFLKNYFEYFSILIQKLPIIYRKAEALKNEKNYDFFIEMSLDFQQLELDQFLLIRIKKMQEILGYFLESKRIYEFLLLFMYLIQKDNSINAFLSKILDESKMLKTFKAQEYYVKLSLKLAESVKNDDIYLYIHSCIGAFYEVFGYDFGKKLYQKGLKLANERNHQFYIKMFSEKLDNYGMEIEFFTMEEMENRPFSDTLKGLEFFHFSKIQSITDPHLRDIMTIAKSDSDPSKILKKCEYILIGYYPSELGLAMGIPSIGIKTVMCSKYERFHELFNLMDGFESFENDICQFCEFKKKRSDDWILTLKKLKDMQIKIEMIKRRKYSR